MKKLSAASATVDRTSRNVLLWTFLAGGCILLAMAGPFLAGRIYTFDDLGSFHLPLRAFYARQLAQDQPFDWMPSLYCGFYLTGEGQAGTYHPLHLLMYKYLSLPTALGLEYLLSYPILWAGGWFFLNRRLHDRAAALFGGMIFFAASFNLLHFVHPNAMVIIAHIPWLLWCIDIVLTDCRRRRVLCATWGIALLTGSQVLLGYPQYVWFSLLAEAAYAGFLMYVFRYAPREGCAEGFDCRVCIGCFTSTWPRIVIGLGLGLLLGSVQWIPTLEALGHSARLSADSAFTNYHSLHPLNLLQLVDPYLFRQRVVGRYAHEFGLYLGAVPLLLIVWLGMKRHELGRLKPLAVASALFAALALILALGRYGLVYSLQQYLPVIGRFKDPCRYLVLFQGGMMLLATLGFYLLVRHYREARRPQTPDSLIKILNTLPESVWKRYQPLWLIALLSATIAAVGLIHHGNPLVAAPWIVLVGVSLFFYAAWLITRVAAGNRGALIQLVLFTAADLGLYGLSNSIYGHTATLPAYIASIATPPGSPPERILCCPRSYNDSRLRIGDQIILRGYDRADGYLGLEPKKLLDYRCLSTLRVAGVRWVQKDFTTKDIQGIRWLDKHWGEVPQPLPRVRLVGKTVVS
ncbi:MAG: hypothetical protein JXB10_16600, partial [Pirellulales bacterium]|nr:hypothetical protein [Pirellulales bacterium]